MFLFFTMNKTNSKWFPILLVFLVPFFGVSCGDSGEPDDSEESKTKESPSAGEQSPSAAKKDNAALAKAQTEAEAFFSSFTAALKAREADRALVMIAESHQYKFGLAYPFWQNCRFFEPTVLDVTGDLMRVQVGFVWPNGRGDREVKVLVRVNGKWRLQDS